MFQPNYNNPTTKLEVLETLAIVEIQEPEPPTQPPPPPASPRLLLVQLQKSPSIPPKAFTAGRVWAVFGVVFAGMQACRHIRTHECTCVCTYLHVRVIYGLASPQLTGTRRKTQPCATANNASGLIWAGTIMPIRKAGWGGARMASLPRQVAMRVSFLKAPSMPPTAPPPPRRGKNLGTSRLCSLSNKGCFLGRLPSKTLGIVSSIKYDTSPDPMC